MVRGQSGEGAWVGRGLDHWGEFLKMYPDAVRFTSRTWFSRAVRVQASGAAAGAHSIRRPPMKLLVLGGGAQGRVIAADLARALPRDQVTVADLHRPQLPGLDNLEWQ